VWRTSSVVATADHNTPTTGWERGYDGIEDPISKEQVTTLDANSRAWARRVLSFSQRQGIVHVIGPKTAPPCPA
jgi:3-isopropylmalate/(R)-2-methylmalate dehydratase large subunit